MGNAVRHVYVWRMDLWQREYVFDLAALPIAVAFADEDNLFLGALKNNSMIVSDLTTGTAREAFDWTLEFENMDGHVARSSILASFWVAEGLLAIAYQGKDIVL